MLWLLAAFKDNKMYVQRFHTLHAGMQSFHIPTMFAKLEAKGLLRKNPHENPEFESWSVTEFGFETLDKTGGRPELPFSGKSCQVDKT